MPEILTDAYLLFTFVFKQALNAVKYLVDQFRACDVSGGAGLFPAAVCDPFSNSLCGHADFFGNGLLRLPLHVEQAGVFALLLTVFFSSHS